MVFLAHFLPHVSCLVTLQEMHSFILTLTDGVCVVSQRYLRTCLLTYVLSLFHFDIPGSVIGRTPSMLYSHPMESPIPPVPGASPDINPNPHLRVRAASGVGNRAAGLFLSGRK
jgi:hypothetical protein